MVSCGPARVRQRAGISNLDLLRMLRRRPQCHGNIVGHLITGNGNDSRVPDRAVGEDRDIRCTAADIDQANTQIALIFGDHGVTRRQLLQNDAVYRQATALHAFLDVLGGVYCTGHEMHFGLQSDTRHSEGSRIPD